MSQKVIACFGCSFTGGVFDSCEPRQSWPYQLSLARPDLKVYNFANKIRLGENCDGGYVIGDIYNNYDCYISAGVSNEESFSRDFINKYDMNHENSYAFDGTINSYP